MLTTNRKTIMKDFEGLLGFHFVEIIYWKQMKKAVVDLIVIYCPEYLPSCVTVQQFKDFIKELNKTLIIVAYDDEIWRLDRKRAFYLNHPDDQKTIDNVKMILALEQRKQLKPDLNQIVFKSG